MSHPLDRASGKDKAGALTLTPDKRGDEIVLSTLSLDANDIHLAE
jgi:hypothetical protein